MRKEVRTEIEINASPARVWAILTDFARFPDWNPFVTRVEGVPRAGANLRIEVRLPGSRPLKFKPLVIKAEAERELSWAGTMPLGAFRGEHFYRIEKISESKVRFIHGEHFSGWMVGIIWRLQGASIEAAYELMNAALKKEAEKK